MNNDGAREALAAIEALVSMCEVHGDFSNGVTDPTGTIDEGAVRAAEIISNARRALAALATSPAPSEPLRAIDLIAYLHKIGEHYTAKNAEQYVVQAQQAALATSVQAAPPIAVAQTPERASLGTADPQVRPSDAGAPAPQGTSGHPVGGREAMRTCTCPGCGFVFLPWAPVDVWPRGEKDVDGPML